MKFDRLKDLREERDLLQKDIADILGVKRSTYAGWETGKDTIPFKRIIMLSKYYKVSIDYIMGLSNKNEYIDIYEVDLKVFGSNLRKFRKENNLKQKDVFKLLNTTSSTYSVYETGKILINTSFIYAIAKEYNISIDKLFL